MNKTLSKLIIVCFIVTLASCKKSSDKNALSMSFKMNGIAENSKATPDAIYRKSQNNVHIIGEFNTSEEISIIIENPKVGTFDANSAILSYSTRPEFGHTYLGETGNVTITNMTTDAIAGTFSFVGTTNGITKTITEGKFSTKLTTQ